MPQIMSEQVDLNLLTEEAKRPLKAPRHVKGYDGTLKNDKIQESYRQRLATALNRDGLDCDTLLLQMDKLVVLKNMVDDLIINKKDINALEGITHKLAYVNLASYSSTESYQNKKYPVINKYHKHNLVETLYLAVDGLGQVEIKGVPMKAPVVNLAPNVTPSGIVLPG